MQGGAEVRIDLSDAEPAYRQITSQLKTLIVEGVLAPGDPLPSVRKLAMDLGVHFNTVADAYRVLAEDGWVDVSQGRAARVLERRTPRAGNEVVESFRHRLRRIIAEMRVAGISAARIRQELRSALEDLES